MRKIALKVSLLCMILGFLLIAIALAVVITSNRTLQKESLTVLESTMRQAFDATIEDQVKTVLTMMDSTETLVDEGLITKGQAKTIAYHMIRQARYGKSGYFWGDDPDGTNRILYGRTDVEGTNRRDLQDIKGYHMIQHFLEAGTAGGGFTDFWFPKEGQTEPLPKRGYTDQSKYFGLVVGTGNYTDDIDAFLGKQETVINTRISKTVRLVIVCSILAYILVIAAGLFIGHIISRPIEKAAKSLENIAEGDGDLTKTLAVQGKDETARLSRSFNRFISKLSGIVKLIRNSVEHAGQESGELVSASTEAAAAVTQINKNSATILELSEQLHGHINNVTTEFTNLSGEVTNLDDTISTQATAIEQSTASIIQMTESINTIAAHTQENRKSVAGLLEVTRNGLVEIDSSKRSVAKLTESIQEIQNAAGIIDNIAQQTNLLAMNAAIEAAHAGDSGKGFAVVADEIRKLAENSARNTASITATLKNNIILIREMDADTDKNAETFTKIDKIAKDTESVFSEITNSMAEMSQGAGEINKAVSSLQNISSDVQTSSRKMNDMLSNLNNSSKIMDGSATETISAITEIRQGIKQISIAMDDLNESVKNISDDVMQIQVQMQEFKI
ncbi:MAG: cache domain-containing protein [Treponema sp.]|jgi:methyl-accepting chemotaxis protein|nr:cache domain-containing protein [Treponema sp.]